MSGLRFTAFALTLAVTPIVSGCGSNPFKPPITPGEGDLPASTPPNDSPQNLMVRFVATYNYQVLPAYSLLLTNDFRFTFSSQTDPLLVDKYGPNWGKDAETTSAENLFNGFTNDLGEYKAGATSINIILNAPAYLEDPFHPGDLEHYQKVSIPVVTGDIEVPDTQNGGTITYNLEARQEFYIVRGDAAVLDSDQTADATRWYIYRWDDLSVPPAARTVELARINAGLGTTAGTTHGTPVTFGALKASVRQ